MDEDKSYEKLKTLLEKNINITDPVVDWMFTPEFEELTNFSKKQKKSHR